MLSFSFFFTVRSANFNCRSQCVATAEMRLNAAAGASIQLNWNGGAQIQQIYIITHTHTHAHIYIHKHMRALSSQFYRTPHTSIRCCERYHNFYLFSAEFCKFLFVFLFLFLIFYFFFFIFILFLLLFHLCSSFGVRIVYCAGITVCAFLCRRMAGYACVSVSVCVYVCMFVIQTNCH